MRAVGHGSLPVHHQLQGPGPRRERGYRKAAGHGGGGRLHHWACRRTDADGVGGGGEHHLVLVEQVRVVIVAVERDLVTAGAPRGPAGADRAQHRGRQRAHCELERAVHRPLAIRHRDIPRAQGAWGNAHGAAQHVGLDRVGLAGGRLPGPVGELHAGEVQGAPHVVSVHRQEVPGGRGQHGLSGPAPRPRLA